MGIGRKFVTFAAVLGVTVIGGGFASAADTVTQSVTFSVNYTRDISINNPTAGFGAVAGTSSSIPDLTGTTLTYSTDATGDRIQAKYGTAVSNATLSVVATTPSKGSAAEKFALSTSYQDLITGITNASSATAGVTYSLVTTGVAASDTAYSWTVSYKVLAGA